MEAQAPQSQPSDSGRATSKTPSGLEALSIRERARRHPRSRIVVEPLLWTKQHLELLQCAFSGPYPAPPQAIMKLDYPGDARRQRGFERDFRPQYGYGYREGAVRCLLAGSEVPLQWFFNLYFYLGGYRSILLPCSYFCLRAECEGDDNVGPAPPVAAHIDQRHIVWMRENWIFRPSTNTQCDRPGAKLAKIKLRRLISTEPLHEPYLVALLIALAQQQWRTLGPATTEQVSGVNPKLLYTSDDSDFMHLYSTKVSSGLIRMFGDPAITPPASQSLEIQITAIPYKPLETLRDRVMALILAATSLGEVGRSDDLIVY